MSWLDTLLDHGNEAKRRAEPAPATVTPAKPRRAPPEIKLVWFQTAAPRNGDQGAVEAAYYSVANGVLSMCDENGKPTGKECPVGPGEDARNVAGRLGREACGKATGTSDFNRALGYQNMGWL